MLLELVNPFFCCWHNVFLAKHQLFGGNADAGAKKQTVGFIKENKDIFGDNNLMFVILLICIPYLKCLKSRVFSRLFDLVIFL